MAKRHKDRKRRQRKARKTLEDVGGFAGRVGAGVSAFLGVGGEDKPRRKRKDRSTADRPVPVAQPDRTPLYLGGALLGLSVVGLAVAGTRGR